MSHTSHIETEVKLWVPDLAGIEWRVQAAGAILRAERLYERNIRYEDAGESLTPADKVLRLRQDTRVRLTYKEPVAAANGILSRQELEVTVSDFETVDLLLQKLGFHPAWVYEKYRTTYELGGCEIVLDEMPFGNFVEIEGAAEDIERALAQIGLAQTPRIAASYSELFFRGKARLGLTFRDLTFENFKGIAVPKELFAD